MTTRERLHRLVDDLSAGAAVEAETALLEVIERQGADEGADAEDTHADATIARTYERTPQTPEVQLTVRGGMSVACVVSLDNLRTVPRALPTKRITELGPERMREVCKALATATAC
jgi:hypothetical protein